MADTAGFRAFANDLVAYAREHSVGLVAVGLILAAGSMITAAQPTDRGWLLLFLAPGIVGACVPLASQDPLSGAINAWELSFTRRLEESTAGQSALSTYCVTPFLRGTLTLWKASEPVENVHVRAGLRLSAIGYLAAAMLFALVLAAIMIIAIVVALLILWGLANYDKSSKTVYVPPLPSGRGPYPEREKDRNAQRAITVDDDSSDPEDSGPTELLTPEEASGGRESVVPELPPRSSDESERPLMQEEQTPDNGRE